MPDDGAQIMAFLDSLSANVERNLLRGALRAGAKVMADRAKELGAHLRTPEIKGKLHTTPSESVADAIYVTTRNVRGSPKASVKIKGFAASVAIWAEYGTLAHWISVDAKDRTTRKGVISIKTVNKNAREGGSLVIGGHFVGPSVYHPGAQAKPFFLEAADQTSAEALAAGAAYINAKIEAGGLNTPDDAQDEEPDE